MLYSHTMLIGGKFNVPFYTCICSICFVLLIFITTIHLFILYCIIFILIHCCLDIYKWSLILYVSVSLTQARVYVNSRQYHACAKSCKLRTVICLVFDVERYVDIGVNYFFYIKHWCKNTWRLLNCNGRLINSFIDFELSIHVVFPLNFI